MILLKQVRLWVFSMFISCVGYGQVMTAEIFSNKDAYVNKVGIYFGTNPATVNYGTEQDLKLLRKKGGIVFDPKNDLQRSYVGFDLAGLISANQIPSNAVVTNATLSFRIGSETGITNTNLLLRKVESSWTETGITFNNQPTLLPDNQITTSVKSTYYELLNPSQVSDRVFNVTGHIQGFIKNPSTFNGWCLSFLDESDLTTELSAVYRSKEYTGCYNGGLCIPRLHIDYYIPYKLTGATVVNASSATATNGSISPVIVNGSGNNSYKWYKNGGTTVIGTGQNLTGQGPGWYGLEVTGSKGDKFYMAFIIGNECGATAINFKPGPNYIESVPILGNMNIHVYNVGGLPPIIGATYDVSNNNGYFNTLSRFRLWMPGNLEVNQADLKLYGVSGTPHGGTINNILLSRNTAGFSVTDSFDSNVYPGPSTTTIGQAGIGTKTGSENAVVDIKNFWTTWKGNNLTNYGFTMSSAVTNSPETVGQVYHSSASNDFNLTPEISFVVLGTSAFNCVCSPLYATLSREQRGDNYPVCVDKFYFRYEEEYTGASVLDYRVYNSQHQVVVSGTTQSLSKEYGENRYALSVGSLSSGTYILEVQNDKKEKFYLRFTK